MNRTEDMLPNYDSVLFKNPALELSLVQLKYPPIPRFGEENFLTDIKEALAEEYPLISVEQGMNIVISLQGIGSLLVQICCVLALLIFMVCSVDKRNGFIKKPAGTLALMNLLNVGLTY